MGGVVRCQQSYTVALWYCPALSWKWDGKEGAACE